MWVAAVAGQPDNSTATPTLVRKESQAQDPANSTSTIQAASTTKTIAEVTHAGTVAKAAEGMKHHDTKADAIAACEACLRDTKCTACSAGQTCSASKCTTGDTNKWCWSCA